MGGRWHDVVRRGPAPAPARLRGRHASFAFFSLEHVSRFLSLFGDTSDTHDTKQFISTRAVTIQDHQLNTPACDVDTRRWATWLLDED